MVSPSAHISFENARRFITGGMSKLVGVDSLGPQQGRQAIGPLAFLFCPLALLFCPLALLAGDFQSLLLVIV